MRNDGSMQETERDGAAVRIPPPLVYLGVVLVGVLLNAFVLPWRLGLAPGWRIAGTAAAVAAGLFAMGAALRLFRSTGQDPKPWEPTPVILATGIYRRTRNPMYVGMALLQIGIGVGLANGWILALVPVVLWLVYRTAIRHEEAYLERKFGETYTSYKRSVRRWL
jgi:protein-S-isoprenylcysteine O-methyltransferase Ste14